MFNRNRRILWLLNHKTLMPFEVRLLIALGFEVFTPKVIPSSPSFRSAAVDYAYDSSLSIPSAVLKRLNEFNFYEDEWPADIVGLVNRYFGVAFVIPYARQVMEALLKFEGQMLFRAFGLDNSQTYSKVLGLMYGSSVFSYIDALGDRFWFAQGYEQLQECEPPILAERAVFLPIGVPETFWRAAQSYIGTDRRILFVCPNCVTNSYYASVYKTFKEQFGDLPHVIVGAQDVPVDDHHVQGFVSDEELARLFRECALSYYHSTELRHVHYSPIEAVINGMPLVYYADSLLGRMTPEVTAGRCGSFEEARTTAERILSGDAEFTIELKAEQMSLSYQFSPEYCEDIWRRNLAESGLLHRLRNEPAGSVLWREGKRTLLRPYANGLSAVPVEAAPSMPSHERLGLSEPDPVYERTLAEGIDFTVEEYPWFVSGVTGVSFPESAGRWSNGDRVVVSFVLPLPSRFRLVVTGGAYATNVGAPVEVKVGRTKTRFEFSRGAEAREEVVLDLHVRGKAKHIEFVIPHPLQPPGDNRRIGIALSSIRIEDAAA